jgi:hypothetical protein
MAIDLRNINDIKQWILTEYGVVSDKVVGSDEIHYDRCVIKKAKPGIFKQTTVEDMWSVTRKGHTEDYMRKAELEKELEAGGGLLYFIIPEDRHY